MATMTTPAMIAMSTPCDELPCEASEDAAVESELAVAVGESAMVAEAEALQLGRSVATYEVVVRAESDGRRISTIRITCFLKEL